MSKIAFIGGEMESYPYRSLGIETVTPPGDLVDLSWAEKLLGGEYRLILVSEEVLDLHAAAVEFLWRRLDRRTALTIVPDPVRPRSGHLHFLRHQTTRSLGVDTWTRDDDVHAGATT